MKNEIIVDGTWNKMQTGERDSEYEQKGNEKAELGTDLLKRLSKDMKERYGNGFGKSSIYNMRKLYLTYPKFQTLSGKLTWSHYIELLKIAALRPGGIAVELTCLCCYHCN